MVPLFAYYQQKNHNLMISCLPRRRPFHPFSGEFMVFAPVLRCWGFIFVNIFCQTQNKNHPLHGGWFFTGFYFVSQAHIPSFHIS
ncbi:hypothetical protein EPB69_01075 [Geobacillus stearothermophilus]|nr:hypothetical protein EPB69_01075 [Geobacillus stearothermophilus]